jgi:hypothetical protein
MEVSEYTRPNIPPYSTHTRLVAILVALLQHSLISSPCFLMVLKVILGIPMALAMSVVLETDLKITQIIIIILT